MIIASGQKNQITLSLDKRARPYSPDILHHIRVKHIPFLPDRIFVLLSHPQQLPTHDITIPPIFPPSSERQ